MRWCNKKIDEGAPDRLNPGTIAMIGLFAKINKLLEVDDTDGEDGILDNDELAFRNHVIENLVFAGDGCDHLPIRFFCIKNPL